MNNILRIFLTYIYLVLSFTMACNAQEKYKKLDSVIKVHNSSDYEISFKKEILILDSFQLGYMGINDSLTIMLNNQIVFDGITDYEPKYGYGSGLCYIYREKKPEKMELKIEFHNLELEVTHLIDLHQHNSLLIENGMTYGIPELKGFSEDMTIHLYKEKYKFY